MDLPILLSCGTLYLHNASDNFPVQGFNIQAVLVMLCIQLQANAKVPLEPLSMRSPDACACFPGLPGEGQVTVTTLSCAATQHCHIFIKGLPSEL